MLKDQHPRNARTVEVLKALIRKNGVPRSIYIDDGFTYVSDMLENSSRKSANMYSKKSGSASGTLISRS